MEKDQVPNTFEDQETFLSAVYDLIQKLKDRYPVSGIAISYCGELDHEKGIIHSPGSYRFNGGFHMRETLEAETGLPVAVENDGNAAMLDGIVERVRDELGEMPSVVATGEFSSLIVPYCRQNVRLDQNLLLKGLRVIYLRNRRDGRNE